MNFKDILKIIIITVVTFPILLLGLCMATGYLRYEFGIKKPEIDVSIQASPRSFYEDSMAVVNSKAYKALIKKQQELASEAEKMELTSLRLEELKQEIKKDKQDLAQTKQELEGVIKKTGDAQKNRLKQLAAVYGAMRPDNAAPILQTLNDQLIVDILMQMREKRQTAKILARFPEDRAGRISKLMSELKKRTKIS